LIIFTASDTLSHFPSPFSVCHFCFHVLLPYTILTDSTYEAKHMILSLWDCCSLTGFSQSVMYRKASRKLTIYLSVAWLPKLVLFFKKKSIKHKMFNIPSHKGNENQNNIKIPSHCSQNGCHQKNKNKCWQGWGGYPNILLMIM
jgi:predicted DNA-binding transcriptional regulator AlpA